MSDEIKEHVKGRLQIAKDSRQNGIILAEDALAVLIRRIEIGSGPLNREIMLRCLEVIHENIKTGIRQAQK